MSKWCRFVISSYPCLISVKVTFHWLISFRLRNLKIAILRHAFLLIVRFQRHSVRNKVFYSRRQLKDYNHDNNTHLYINEDLTDFRGKLFAETRQKAKDGKIDSAWTSNGTIHAKAGAGRIVNILTREDLRLL